MSFEITIPTIESEADILYAAAVSKYGCMACTYVRKMLMFGRVNLNTQRELYFGHMLINFYLRIADDTNIVGSFLPNSDILQDGQVVGALEILFLPTE